MTSKMVSEIAKAKRYAEEPERIQFTRFEATFRGENNLHTTTYDNGEWNCTCRFFHDWSDCGHVIAMKRILGVTLPKEPDQVISTIDIQDMRICITQTPLTPQNLVTIISPIVELYTKCWLIVRGRFADLIEFTQTRSSHYIEEANLVIPKDNSEFTFEYRLEIRR